MKNKALFFTILLLSFLVAGMSGSSCNRQAEVAADAVEYAVAKEYERGPVNFQIKVDKTEITIAEKINLVLEVTAHKSYIVSFPDVYDTLADQFINIEVLTLPARAVDNDNIRTEEHVTMEPLLSGEYKIPPLNFKYWTEEDTEDNAHILETEEIPVTIKSILPEDLEQLVLQDIINPLIPPPPDLTWLIILVLCVLVLGGGGTVLGVFLYKRKQAVIAASFIPAHELAFRQLEVLVAGEYIARGEYKLFYGEISNILRHYIENRFGIHAPESTTEEFLGEIRSSEILESSQKGLLKDFLNHCDLVKFAELSPTTEQIQNTFDICKNFILETRDKSAVVEEPEEDPSAEINYPENDSSTASQAEDIAVAAATEQKTEKQEMNDDQI